VTINPAYLVLAVSIAALWGLRRAGMDASTADAIVTALMLGLGFTPSPTQGTVPKVASEPHVEVTKVDP
jgi:hypothetical protein